MQKHLQISLVLLLTLMSFSLKAQIVNIPDANFKNALITLGIDKNGDGEIQESEALEVTYLTIPYNNISDLTGIEFFKNLSVLECYSNNLTSLDVNMLSKLYHLDCADNQLTSLDVSNLSNLTYLYCYDNQLSNIDVSNLTQLYNLSCGRNQLSNLNVSSLVNLEYLHCDNNKLTTLDAQSPVKLVALICTYNPLLEVIYVKNNIYNKDYFELFEGNLNLKYICTDANETSEFKQTAIDFGYPNVIISSFCNSAGEGEYYTLFGNAKLDMNNNGCEEGDMIYPNLKVKITNASESDYIYSDINGIFYAAFNADTVSFQPILDHPNYFIVNPKTATFTLPDTISPSFCITPNGVHNDLSISVIPTIAARPGFSDATYKVVYKNQGTTTQSGTVAFNYDETKMNFISASPIADNTSAGNVSYDFSNLAPFETRSALITMRTNSPTDNPAINSGDVLEFTSTITGATDETPDDNLATLNQTVVGSFDPNDKTCLEGEIVSPELIGKNVHYLIRFENTGTANAENIVVTDFIDTTVFEISTMQITDASHICHTQISQGNKVQFIFSDIQLPFTEPDKHGYVAFSIKLKEDLVIGDSIKNKADIFFDYNLPIQTNIAAAEINYKTVTYIGKNQTLQGSLDIYPNPSNGQFTLELKANIKAPVQISILNVEGQVVFAKTLNHQNQSNLPLDLKHLAKGVYLIKAQIENDVLSKKVVIQ
ncbi:MAG TPA: T9SS type A sorting domain-containing protein [Chitinophagales bacterium]|nr:T9SS type A sorting domain-containing protein [Chitinophagales bacterium]